jgi:hypothetical protein
MRELFRMREGKGQHATHARFGRLWSEVEPAQITAEVVGVDLRRLRLRELIERVPHTNIYVVTPERIRSAVFFTKVHDRVLRPLPCAAHVPPASPELRHAVATIDNAVGRKYHYRTTRVGRVNPSHRSELRRQSRTRSACLARLWRGISRYQFKFPSTMSWATTANLTLLFRA